MMASEKFKMGLLLAAAITCVAGLIGLKSCKNEISSTDPSPVIYTVDPFHFKSPSRNFPQNQIINANGVTSEIYKLFLETGDGTRRLLTRDLILYSADNPTKLYTPVKDPSKKDELMLKSLDKIVLKF
jgi:hypothetical protein